MAEQLSKATRHELIPLREVPSDDAGVFACPHCHLHNLILYGNLQVQHVQTWAEDPQDPKGYREINSFTANGGPLIQEVLSIECRDCQVLFQVQTDENFELQRSNLELGRRLLEVSGEDLLGNGRPC
jgi:hypothetical protein